MQGADRAPDHGAARGSVERREDGQLAALMRRWVEELTAGEREDALSLSVALVVALSDELELERQRTARLRAALASVPDRAVGERAA